MPVAKSYFSKLQAFLERYSQNHRKTPVSEIYLNKFSRPKAVKKRLWH